jgi:hypothetical protein
MDKKWGIFPIVVVILLILIVSFSEPVQYTCEPKGVAINMKEYEYNFGPRCVIETETSLYRAYGDACDEFQKNKIIYKCVKRDVERWVFVNE